MAPVKVNDDYYAVLEISNTATLEIVTKNYRRLALIRHPDKNRNANDSTAVFQLLQNAYDTISDPEKRRAYDTEWESIRDRIRLKQNLSSRQTKTSEAEKERTTKEATEEHKEADARKERICYLENLVTRYYANIFELNGTIRKLKNDLNRLQEYDKEDLKKQKEQSSLWAHLVSLIHGNINIEQKRAQEIERLHRVASKTIKQSELLGHEAKLRRLEEALKNVKSEIEKKAQEEAQAQARAQARAQAQAQAQAREEKIRQEQEARGAQQELRERWAKAQKEQRERAAKEAREAQAAREAQEAQEYAQKVAAMERRKRETEQRAQAKRAAAETARKAQNTSGSNETNCQHKKFWPKVEGRQICRKCCTFQRRFAFQCPGCGMIACANCRRSLRGENL